MNTTPQPFNPGHNRPTLAALIARETEIRQATQFLETELWLLTRDADA